MRHGRSFTKAIIFQLNKAPEQECRERPVGPVRLVRGGGLSPKVVEERRGEVDSFRVDNLVLDNGGDVVKDEGAEEAGGKCDSCHDGDHNGSEPRVFLHD